jgi:hypothetical protein
MMGGDGVSGGLKLPQGLLLQLLWRSFHDQAQAGACARKSHAR